MAVKQKKLLKSERAATVLTKLKDWIETVDRSDSWARYDNGKGGLNRTKIAKEIDCSRSELYVRDNKATLDEAEKRWFPNKVISTREDRLRSEQARVGRIEASSKQALSQNSDLLDEIAQLKAENAFLKDKLAKYSYFEEVLLESGQAPL